MKILITISKNLNYSNFVFQTFIRAGRKKTKISHILTDPNQTLPFGIYHEKFIIIITPGEDGFTLQTYITVRTELYFQQTNTISADQINPDFTLSGITI